MRKINVCTKLNLIAENLRVLDPTISKQIFFSESVNMRFHSAEEDRRNEVVSRSAATHSPLNCCSRSGVPELLHSDGAVATPSRQPRDMAATRADLRDAMLNLAATDGAVSGRSPEKHRHEIGWQNTTVGDNLPVSRRTSLYSCRPLGGRSLPPPPSRWGRVRFNR